MKCSGICPDPEFLSVFQAGGGDRAICPIILPSIVSHQFSTRALSDSSLILTILGHGVYDMLSKSSFQDSRLMTLSLWRKEGERCLEKPEVEEQQKDTDSLGETAIFTRVTFCLEILLCMAVALDPNSKQ